MQGQLKFTGVSSDKLEVAARLSGVKLSDAVEVGNETILTAKFSDAQTLVEFGKRLEKLSDKDVAGIKKLDADRQAAKEKKAAAAKK